MKTYYGEQQFRIVGKCWEVRAKLKAIAGAASRKNMTLQQFLTQMAPVSTDRV